jgi:dihydroneopterin aldolase
MLDNLNEDDILSQVRDEYERGYNLVNPIRDVFRKDLKRYYNEKKKKSKDKVGDTTMYNIHSALLARMYVNSPQTKFDVIEIAHEETINNLNMAFKEDYECQEMEVHKYQQLWDSLFY